MSCGHSAVAFACPLNAVTQAGARGRRFSPATPCAPPNLHEFVTTRSVFDLFGAHQVGKRLASSELNSVFSWIECGQQSLIKSTI